MARFFVLIFSLSFFLSLSQEHVSADWSISINGNDVTLSIVEFNNFTVGLDGHWHYIINDEDYVAVHDINDVLLTNLPAGDHTLLVWLVDHMHNTLNPPVEEIIEFTIDSELSTHNTMKLDMMVYPNPVDANHVTILSPLKGLKEIQVFTVTGKKLLETYINGNIFDVSSFNSGLYMLKITIDGQSKVFRLAVR